MATRAGGQHTSWLRNFILLLVLSAIVALFFSCVSKSSSSAEQRSSRSATATAHATGTSSAKPAPAKPSQAKPAPAKPAPSKATRTPSPSPTKAPAAPYTGPRPTPPIPVGAVADLPRKYRPAATVADGTGGVGAWTLAAVVIWSVVGGFALLILALAVVSHRQRRLPLTYLRPRNDHHVPRR